jgi:subtilisin family serine protease
MAGCVVRARWGLGPRVDPHFDARVGRAAVGLGSGQQSSAVATGYIELLGARPYDYLVALFEVLYDRPPFGSSTFYSFTKKLKIHDRPNIWTQIRALRYLTTDAATGVALPLHDFNPNKDDPGWPGNAGAKLQQALDRLNSITENRLQSASMIGLTVGFEYGVVAKKLKSVLRPSLMKRVFGVSERKSRAKIEQALFGGANPSWGALGRLVGTRVGARKFDAQDLAASSGFSPQLKRAMRELSAGNPQAPPPGGDLNYGIVETGRNVIVGLVDFGCDFAHSSFCSGALEKESRILALWDQNREQEGAPTQQPIVTPGTACAAFGVEKCGFGYGRLFTKEQIDLVLKTWRETCPDDKEAPYRMLGYDPHDHHYTSIRPGDLNGPLGAHGTMVLDAAAGSRRVACRLVSESENDNPTVCGVAPEAKIVFVQVRLHKQQDGRRVLDANDVVDAVAFIFHTANQQQLPCVVNLSLNTMSGPHDGDGHFERRLSSLLKSRGAGPDIKGRAVVIAAGNLPINRLQAWQHITDCVPPGQSFEFSWRPPDTADKTRNSVEIWYDPGPAWLRVSAVSPTGELFGPIAAGEAAELLVGSAVRGSIVGSRIRPAMRDNDPLKGMPLPKDDSTAGRHVILLELDSQLAIEGCWKILLEAVDKTHTPLQPGAAPPVPFHAWLERDDDGQSGICRTNPATPIEDADLCSTIGTLSCGEDSIVVGAYETSTPATARWGLSGCGPRRNGGVPKPDISAPGHNILLIRSKMAHAAIGRCAPASGTSMAAPFVTGTIACMYEVAPRARLSTVRKALTSNTRPGFGDQPWSSEFGYGRLNPPAALSWFKSNLQPEDV